MDRSDVVQLVSRTYTNDSNGIAQATESSREVFCSVNSVTASEWFNGGRNGLNPQYMFKMFQYDYQGEPVIIYNNVRYTVYRTYVTRDDSIEVYAELRKGNG